MVALVPEDCVSVAVRIGIIGFGLLVAVAAYEAYTRPGDPPELIAAQNAVARDIAQKLIASLPPEAPLAQQALIRAYGAWRDRR